MNASLTDSSYFSILYQLPREKSTLSGKRECPNAELKEVKEGKRDSSPWMTSAIAFFLQSETVVGLNKNSKNCLEIFQFSGKASASPCQRRDIMAQISVDTLNSESVLFVVNIVNMLSRIYHIPISNISVCVISTGFWRGVYHPLYSLSCFVLCHIKARYHAWISAYRGHHIHIFAGFSIWLFTNKPV